jgi:hypothetical protein
MTTVLSKGTKTMAREIRARFSKVRLNLLRRWNLGTVREPG